MGGFLWQENNLRLLTALWLGNNDFSILNISWFDVQNLTDPHAASGHEFQNEAVSRIPGPEDDFINDFLFKDFPLGFLGSPEYFPENGGIAWVWQVFIQ